MVGEETGEPLEVAWEGPKALSGGPEGPLLICLLHSPSRSLQLPPQQLVLLLTLLRQQLPSAIVLQQ
ncbi:hypothetical protein Emag_004106 [Eimeria magna]